MPGERVIVVGAGIMGRAAAWHLALAGAQVTVLEQQGDPTSKEWTGSSHGATRGLRYSYEDPAYARLAMHAETWWRVAERASGTSLLRMTGGLDLGAPGTPSFDRTVRTVRDLGLDHELLDADEVRRRFDAFDPAPGMEALFQPGAGLIDASAAMDAFARLAADAGAVFAYGTRVGSVDVDDSITVRATSGDQAHDYRADRLVVAAGPWTGALLATTGGSLRVRSLPLEVVQCEPVYLQADAPVPLDLLFFLHAGVGTGGDSQGLYVQPQPDTGGAGGASAGGPSDRQVPAGTRRIKVGIHGGVPIDHPDRPLAEAPVREGSIRDRLTILPGFAHARVAGRDRCFYTMTPDERFVVDHLDTGNRVVVAAGFSGHGFKFAPVIGRAISELLLDGETGFQTDGMRIP